MATTVADVHSDFNLYITPEKFYIEPIASNNELLVIDRVSQEVRLDVNTGQVPRIASSKQICGILGTIKLLAGPYLVVITKKKKIGEINNQAIWQIIETEVISYTRTLLHLTEKQIYENKIYLSMVEFVLNVPFLYFSYTYDLTHTLQRLHNTTPEFLQMPLHERADPRFVWNGHLLRDFANQPELQRYCLPVLHGFISINHCTINSKNFVWTLISRRCCFRAGCRLFMRGLDVEGNVANYVETEQIVEHMGDKASFVQTRGSIPLFWSQLPNLKYKPRPVLSLTENHAEGFSRHFDNQIFNYGRQVAVNLVNHTGAEEVLEQAYKEMIMKAANPDIRYEAFDFHHECRKMQWDRLSILIDRLAHEQDEFGYFLMTRDGTLVGQQDGIFRTNCIDCLDRTNVVQSMLARRNLQIVLERLGILKHQQQLEDHVALEFLFKNVWADNADFCSIQYAGAGALKTDYTRTGKRTRWGLMRDGMNSLLRYYRNNFSDGFRQDAIDLFLGHYVVHEGEGVIKPCPLEIEKGWKYLTFPLVMLVAIAMCFATVSTSSEYTTERLLYLLFWGSMVAITFSTIMYYGTEYVDYPRLCERRILGGD